MSRPRPLTTLALAAAVASLAAACADSPPLGIDDDGLSPHGPAAHGLAPHGRGDTHADVTVPFQARFYTDLAELRSDPACGAPPRLLNVQVGAGEGTHLGRFDVIITFCVDATDLLDDGQITEGESAPYDTGVGTFIAADGSELHITISGTVLPSDHPDFDLEFSDPFQITGGSDRLAGAEGAGLTDSLVDLQVAPSRTTHVWSGTLTLPRPGR